MTNQRDFLVMQPHTVSNEVIGTLVRTGGVKGYENTVALTGMGKGIDSGERTV